MEPLTGPMKEILMDCHERELLQQEPANYGTQSTKGLVKRGMLTAFLYKMPNGKSHLAFSITVKGKKYLQKYSLDTDSSKSK